MITESEVQLDITECEVPSVPGAYAAPMPSCVPTPSMAGSRQRPSSSQPHVEDARQRPSSSQPHVEDAALLGQRPSSSQPPVEDAASPLASSWQRPSQPLVEDAASPLASSWHHPSSSQPLVEPFNFAQRPSSSQQLHFEDQQRPSCPESDACVTVPVETLKSLTQMVAVMGRAMAESVAPRRIENRWHDPNDKWATKKRLRAQRHHETCGLSANSHREESRVTVPPRWTMCTRCQRGQPGSWCPRVMCRPCCQSDFDCGTHD